MKHLVATEGGRIYAVSPTGELLAYHHTGYANGAATWEEPPIKLADGWGNYVHVFAAMGATPDSGPR
jgi:hypothetical protein